MRWYDTQHRGQSEHLVKVAKNEFPLYLLLSCGWAVMTLYYGSRRCLAASIIARLKLAASSVHPHCAWCRGVKQSSLTTSPVAETLTNHFLAPQSSHH